MRVACADGFKTIIESEVFPKGLSEDVVRAISAKKEEPEWLLEFRWVLWPATWGWPFGGCIHRCTLVVPECDLIVGQASRKARYCQQPTAVLLEWPTTCHCCCMYLLKTADTLCVCCRLKAYRKWLTMEEPKWSDNRYPRIDFQVGGRSGFPRSGRRAFHGSAVVGIHPSFVPCWSQHSVSSLPKVQPQFSCADTCSSLGLLLPWHPILSQGISYYSAPKALEKKKSLDEASTYGSNICVAFGRAAAQPIVKWHAS